MNVRHERRRREKTEGKNKKMDAEGEGDVANRAAESQVSLLLRR